MRIRMKVNPRIWDDVNQKLALFAFDDTAIEETYDGFQRCTSGKFSLPISSAGPPPVTGTEALALGDITAVKGIFIKADGDFNLSLNSSTPALQVRRAGATSDFTAKVLVEASITSASITNATSPAVVVTGTWAVWGDPST